MNVSHPTRRDLLRLGAALPLLLGAASAQPSPAPAAPLGVPNAQEALWALTLELRATLQARFGLIQDARLKNLERFSSAEGRSSGELRAYAGGLVARTVHSRIQAGPFGTLRLTTWLSDQTAVPHLVMEFGTLPGLFVYLDYAPRSDLMSDLAALERYYTPANAEVLKFEKDRRFTAYHSPSPYVRAFQSPASLCYSAAADADALEVVSGAARTHLERWLGWVEAAERVPGHRRAALAARDRTLMQQSAERDPGNLLAARLFGPELAGTLVRALWTSEA